MNLDQGQEAAAQPSLHSAPEIAAVGLALPADYVEQAVLTAALREHWTRKYGNSRRLDEFHRAVRVSGPRCVVKSPVLTG